MCVHFSGSWFDFEITELRHKKNSSKINVKYKEKAKNIFSPYMF